MFCVLMWFLFNIPYCTVLELNISCPLQHIFKQFSEALMAQHGWKYPTNYKWKTSSITIKLIINLLLKMSHNCNTIFTSCISIIKKHFIKFMSVRANPEFGSILISEVSGRWTSEFGSFRTLSPFGKRMLQRVEYWMSGKSVRRVR